MAVKNKIIFKSNQTPNPSDLNIGELIINVTDRKVFSKDRNNVVFEIQGGTGDSTNSYTSSSFNNNIITFNQGDGTIDQIDLTPIINASGDDDWFIDSPNSRLTSSLHIFVGGDITGSNLRLGVGSSTRPAITFGSDDTGIFSAASGILSLQANGGGTELTLQDTKASFGASTPVLIQNNLTASGNISASGFIAAQYLQLKDNDPLPSPEKGIIIYSASVFYAGIEA